MKQSINLYPESLRPKQDPLSVARVGRGLGLLLLLLGAYSAYLFYDVSQNQSRLSVLQNQVKQLQQSRLQLEEALLASTSSQILDQELMQSEQRLRAYQQLIRRLSNQQSQPVRGFSSYLEGLARQQVTSTWLTHITLAEGGERLFLEGLSRSADQVPQWIIQMKTDPVFGGKTFASLDMKQTDENASTLRFAIASHLEANDESN